jgi:hypothetical protein
MQMQKPYIPFFLLTAWICLLFHSCSTCSRQQQNNMDIVDENDLKKDSAYVKMAQNVFYSLPTPIEMSILIKNLGIEYQATLLNDPMSVSKYVTNSKLAINFGIYVTDLVYAGLFDQTQTMLRYKVAIQKIVDALGMAAALDNNLIKSLEKNINNKEDMLRILSELYSSCSAYLNDDTSRKFLIISTLVGGWVEGMYIASSLTNEKLAVNEKQIEQLVIDQKLTFDMIWQAMSDAQKTEQVPEIAALMSEMTVLAQAFDKVKVDQTQSKVKFDEKSQSSVIESVSLSSVDMEAFTEIKQQIQTLRYNFIK